MTRTHLGTLALALCAGTTGSVRAADVTWDNGASDFIWDTSSLNWGGAAWNNAAGDGAVFGPAGVGLLDVPLPVFVDSLSFTADGYSLSGSGSLNIMAGSSTQTTGVVNVSTGTTKIHIPVNSTLGFQKIGAGTLELNAPCSFGGGIPLTANGQLRADLMIGGTSGPVAAGITRIGNSSVLPSSTRVSIANGLMDIGGNTVTIGQLTFVNQTTSTPWDPVNNIAASGIFGSGTLRVLGDVNVIGVTGGNQSSNTIAANLDMGGGTQVFRVGLTSSIGLSAALQVTGSISNGSLLKTVGITSAGVQGSIDGMSLHGNNTYTGSTVFNSGTNVVTGTNASTSVKIAGIPAGPAGGSLALQGANGSYLSATLVEAQAGGTLILDNNAAMGASGNNQPNIPAAQNNDRIRDDAALELRDGNFTYRGRASTAASETIGSMEVVGGHAVVTMTPGATGGTAALTVAGDLTMAPRSTMTVSSTTLGTTAQVFVNGAVPTADATGILPRIATTSDFVTYSGLTGMTPFTGYAADFSTAGANVAVAAASTVASSVSVNALKHSGTFTTTVGAGQTLNVASGMILNATGTWTLAGGTLDFGSTPGAFFGGTNTVSSAITGSDGLINANATLTLSGDLSGLSGTITTNNGTTTLATNTFAGPLNVRAGTLNINTSQTGANLGAITLGVAQNDANLVGLVPTLNFSGAGVNAIIDRDIIVDNGAFTAAGMDLSFSTVTRFSPLSNTTGSQTISGDLTLNSPVNLQGGAGTGTGSTNFTGAISGPARFIMPNGRASFSGAVSNAGGFLFGNTGFTAQATFTGTGSGTGPITISGGNNIQLNYENGSLPGGAITSFNVGGANGAPTITALENSNIGNTFVLNGNVVANMAAGVTAEWSGPITGASTLTKTGAGTLVLSNVSSTHSGPIAVTGGQLNVDGFMPSASLTVASGAVLGGVGAITGNTVINIGGLVSPGNSVGALQTGSLTLAGGLRSEIDLNGFGPSLADVLEVIGSVSLINATLDLPMSNLPPIDTFAGATFLIVDNDGSDAVTGSFASITGLPSGYVGIIDYAYSGTDALGRVGDGNDIAVYVVPSPAVFLTVAGFGAVQLGRRRRR